MAFDGPSQPGVKRGKRSAKYFSLEGKIRLYCLIFSLPIVAMCAVFVRRSSFAVQATVLGLLIVALLILSSLLLEEVVRPLQTLANVVAALREDDYSFRARGSRREDALGELSTEINALADLLQSQRLGELEAGALLRRVIASIDAPVLAFDQSRRLRMMNPAAERALALHAESASGRRAEELDLAHLLDEPSDAVVALGGDAAHPTARKSGRWMARRSSFRQLGAPHTLVLLSDVSSVLREEERVAWQRLIRVLGHEISNSLAPIKSIAGSLRARLGPDGTTDFARGLTIIEGRAESLNRFVQAYRQLAQLPAPVVRPFALRPLLERVIALETRMEVTLSEAEDIDLVADPDQLEQLLINLVKNAVEAVLGASEDSPIPTAFVEAQVMIGAHAAQDAVTIQIEDRGLGLTNTANLFVPFYTTKRNGSGVGLALVRQIAEAHGGSVSLRNRDDGPGCVAEVRLPLG